MKTDDLLGRLHHFEKYQLEHGDEYGAEVLHEAVKRIQKLEKWVNDLQSGMYINCVYCGHNYGPQKDTPVCMADVLKKHIEKCPDHPLSAYKKCIEEGHDYGDEPECSRCGHYGPEDREHILRMRIEQLEAQQKAVAENLGTTPDDSLWEQSAYIMKRLKKLEEFVESISLDNL